MHDLDACQYADHQHQILCTQPTSCFRKPGHQLVKLNDDQNHRRQNQHSRSGHEPRRKQPVAPSRQPAEHLVRIKATKTNRQQIREFRPALRLRCIRRPGREHPSITGLLRNEQPLLNQLSQKPTQLFRSQYLWSEPFSKRRTNIANGDWAFQLAHDKILFVSQFVITESDRIFHTPTSTALLSRRDLQVRSLSPRNEHRTIQDSSLNGLCYQDIETASVRRWRRQSFASKYGRSRENEETRRGLL